MIDLDDTLYSFKDIKDNAQNKLIDFLSSNLKVPKEEVVSAIKICRETVHNDLHGMWSSHSRLLYSQKAIEYLIGRSDSKLTVDAEEVFWSTILSEMKSFEWVIDFLSLLKSKNIQIIVLTNLTTHIQLRKILKLWLENYIDFMVSSEEAWAEKPNKKIFDLWLKKLKLKKEEVCMIGDSIEADCIWAQNYGIPNTFLKVENRSNMDEELAWIVKFNDFIELCRLF